MSEKRLEDLLLHRIAQNTRIVRKFSLVVVVVVFYFIFKLYIIVLVLPNIKMNLLSSLSPSQASTVHEP